MNCTAWNSLRANALTNRPSAMPSTAFAIATATTSPAGPAVSRPSNQYTVAHATSACAAAATANAIP